MEIAELPVEATFPATWKPVEATFEATFRPVEATPPAIDTRLLPIAVEGEDGEGGTT